MKPVFLRCLACVVCLTFLVCGAFTWYYLKGPGYYAEMNAVREHLEGIPGVEILGLDGVEDITIEHISARINVAGKGELTLFNLNEDSFHHSESLFLRSIGQYDLRVQGEGYVGVHESATGMPVRSQFYGGDADIGPAGEFASLFPFEIATVQTVVERYDDILRIIAAWPEESNKAHFRDKAGTDYYYYVENRNAQQAGAPNP